MKKLILVVVCFILLIASTSCTGKSLKDKYYIEIVLTTEQKINLCLDRTVAPITVMHFVE